MPNSNSPGTSSIQDRTEDGGGEEDLWTIWGRIVNDWEIYWKKQNGWVRDLVRRGIPLHFRAIVWQLLCSATEAPEKKLYAEYIKVSVCVFLNLCGTVDCSSCRPNRPARK